MDSIEQEIGHPGDMWATLREHVQSTSVTQFSTIQDQFLAVMWCLDQYRINGIPPRDMGNANQPPSRRLAAIYRSKGNWFADLVALLLENQTRSPLAPRSNVQGFSQLHQIDVAWPVRTRPIVDPLVCAETKMTGAPPFGDTPARGAIADFSNRRKELKFAATDLKLYRRQQQTQIDHWDNWRKKQPPRTFVLWAARMTPRDNLETMVAELRALTETYLDGAGLFAYRQRADGPGYDVVALSQRDRTAQLDDVLHRIANEINDLAGPNGEAPAPQVPIAPAVDVTALTADQSGAG